jgi:hypothetical protein
MKTERLARWSAPVWTVVGLLSACGEPSYTTPDNVQGQEPSPPLRQDAQASGDAEIRTLPGPVWDGGVPMNPSSDDVVDADGGQFEVSRTVFECPAVPTAYFLDFADPYTGLQEQRPPCVRLGLMYVRCRSISPPSR